MKETIAVGTECPLCGETFYIPEPKYSTLIQQLVRVARAANVVSELALVQVSGVRADACVVLRKCLKELPEGLLE